MGKLTFNLIVTLENKGGVLDTYEAHNEDDAALGAVTLIDQAGELHDGDIIRVVRKQDQ